MSDILIKGVVIPNNCFECEWRDAEACGECELMISNPFRSFEDQYSHCPFKVIGKRHPIITIPPHGRLIDADKLQYEDSKVPISELDYVRRYRIDRAPTIIEATGSEET